MKHIITICSIMSLGITLHAAPQWECNYSGDKPVYKGMKAPEYLAVKAPASGTLKLDGKTQYMRIPAKCDLSKGGTFYAIVKLEDSATKGNGPETMDMIFFRNFDFLLGRSGKSLYFNFGIGNRKWAKGFFAPFTPNAKWRQVAVVFQPQKDGCSVQFFVDGANAGQFKTKEKYVPSNFPIGIGKGWGGPWFLKGEIAQVAVYTELFDRKEISKCYKRDVLGRFQ